MELNKKLLALREKQDKTQAEMGEIVGVSGTAWHKYETQKAQISHDKIEKLIKYFGIDPSYFFGGSDDLSTALSPSPDDTGGHIPLIHVLPLGRDDVNAAIDAKTPGGETVPYSEIASSIAIKISCDAMAPHIRDGDVIIISTSREPMTGDLVVARTKYESQAVVRRIFYEDGGVVRLLPLAAGCPSLVIHESELDNLIIVGVVVEQRRLKP